MHNLVTNLVSDIKIPQMIRIRQKFPRIKIEPSVIPSVIETEMQKGCLEDAIHPGMRIAITAGSRGICNIALITREIVKNVKKKGGIPFIVPAMGSHGGATAAGQVDILTEYGITEEYTGAPILSSMETVQIGNTTEGHKVFIDKNAASADGIIVCGRVKPHTCFRGEYESGLMKMMAIGLGKQYGASICHTDGFGHMAHMIPLFGKTILKNASICMGIALVENPFDETYKITALHPSQFEAEEPKLLKESASLMPRIRFDSSDILIVDKIGKNFSGDGMDPNITGTFASSYASGNFHAKQVAVLDLSDESHGNGNGIGTADVTTKRFSEKMIPEISYPNAITARLLKCCNIPVVMENDRAAIQVLIKTSVGINPDNPRIVRIPNSLSIEHIMISTAMREEAENNPDIVIESDPFDLSFNEEGNLF